MKFLFALLIVAPASLALSIDHNNIDSGRPLGFDDAYSIAFGERSFQIGLSFEAFRRTNPQLAIKTELKYGFAKNQSIGIGIEPSLSSRASDIGNLELSYFNGLQRETEYEPGLAFRVDVGLPTGRDSRGVDVRLRGIATRSVSQFERIHVNVDVKTSTAPSPGERQTRAGVLIGYSKPIGYPIRFDQTMVAKLSFSQSRDKLRDWVGSVGIGMRQQVGVNSILDYGIESDVFDTGRRGQSALRFKVGYSVGF